MISSRINLIVGAAILASTVYFLWIKIKKNKPLPKSESNDSCLDNIQNSKDSYSIKNNFNNDNCEISLDLNIGEDNTQHISDNSDIENENISDIKPETNFKNYNLSVDDSIDNSLDSNVSNYLNLKDSVSEVINLDESSVNLLCNNFQSININISESHDDLVTNNELLNTTNVSLISTNEIEEGEIVEESVIEEIQSDMHVNITQDLEDNITDMLNLSTENVDNLVLDLTYELEEGELIDQSIIEIQENEPVKEISESKVTIDMQNNFVDHVQDLSEDLYELEEGELINQSIEEENIKELSNNGEILKKASINKVDTEEFTNEVLINENVVEELIKERIDEIVIRMAEDEKYISIEDIIVKSPINENDADESLVNNASDVSVKDLVVEEVGESLIIGDIVVETNNELEIEVSLVKDETEMTIIKDCTIDLSVISDKYVEESFVKDVILESVMNENQVEESLLIENDNNVEETVTNEVQFEEILEKENVQDVLVNDEILDESLINEIQKDLSLVNKDIANVSFVKHEIVDESIIKEEKVEESLKNDIVLESSLVTDDILEESVTYESQFEKTLEKENIIDVLVKNDILEDLLINGEQVDESLVNTDMREYSFIKDEIIEESIIKEDSLLNEDISEASLIKDNIGNNIISNGHNINYDSEIDVEETNKVTDLLSEKTMIDTTDEEYINKFKSVDEQDSISDISQTSDLNDSPLDKLLVGGTLMEYIEECLNNKESDNHLLQTINEGETTNKLENWPNDEDCLNNIKRDFYDLTSNICSPHPSSESDHAHCVNNLTERVAILSAESILDSQGNMHSSDSEMTPTLSSPSLDDCNPELYVEKISYGGKELDVVYFEESLLEEGGVQTDIKIIRTIPVGLGGRIIGKKGKTKNELMKKFGAQLLIYNHPEKVGKQVLEITCNPSVSDQLEKWVNKTLEQITNNTIQTTVSNPEWLKPMIPLGKLVIAHVVDMPNIQHIKLRIFDPDIINAYNAMQKEMNIDYANGDNTSLLPRPVAIGCICVAMVRPDYFLRAQIIEIYEDVAWVYLFDIGKVCQTYMFYLFKIREKYMRVPFQVIPARLPHALIKNKNITPAIIYKRFLCDQRTMKPRMVRVFFPRMNSCCEPCANIYIPMSTVSESTNNEEFIDLLELLVSIDVCSMVRETINSEVQIKINSNHFKSFLNEKDKKQVANITVPVYFKPCNSKFYDDYIEFNNESS